jgi:class 3 adenylate cyclase
MRAIAIGEAMGGRFHEARIAVRRYLDINPDARISTHAPLLLLHVSAAISGADRGSAAQNWNARMTTRRLAAILAADVVDYTHLSIARLI